MSDTMYWANRAEAAEAKVARVEALLNRSHPAWDVTIWIRQDAVRAALDGAALDGDQ